MIVFVFAAFMVGQALAVFLREVTEAFSSAVWDSLLNPGGIR
jgi:hypothetical protein